MPTLEQRLNLFDVTMIVMGGIVGAGIFVNPYLVAQQVHTPALILGAWIAGGVIALLGAFVYAELAAMLPHIGGQYAYFREAYHPAVAFVYGWTQLLVTQTGGMAAVAITFARYFREMTRAPWSDAALAVSALGCLTIINCLGVRAGSNVQNVFMVLKLAGIFGLIACGLLFTNSTHVLSGHILDRPVSFDLLIAFGAAMTPVMFAYGGWQTASFIAGELRKPQRDLSRGVLIGVVGVIALYVGVTLACLRALGAERLAQTTTPASSVMRMAFGDAGAFLIALGIAVSTFGYLSQGMLTVPRVYFAMARDGLFFKRIAAINTRTRVPVLAITLQGIFASLIAASGKYEQILNYVISVNFLEFALAGVAVFALRRRMKIESLRYRVPLHPITTTLFIIACALVVISTTYKYPVNSFIGLAIVASGIPVYFLWRARRR